MVIDDVMNTGKKTEVSQQLEDLDHADDISLLSHTFNNMYMKLKDLENIGKTVGLKIKCELCK
jgi:hypothetical protein